MSLGNNYHFKSTRYHGETNDETSDFNNFLDEFSTMRNKLDGKNSTLFNELDLDEDLMDINTAAAAASNLKKKVINENSNLQKKSLSNITKILNGKIINNKHLISFKMSLVY